MSYGNEMRKSACLECGAVYYVNVITTNGTCNRCRGDLRFYSLLTKDQKKQLREAQKRSKNDENNT